MLDFERLAELLFPQIKDTPADIEARFPARVLPEGAKVTRCAPSPTGFVHFGGLFPTTVAERLAHQSSGVLYLRIEDTDAKREVPGAAEGLIKITCGSASASPRKRRRRAAPPCGLNWGRRAGITALATGSPSR